MRVGVAGPCRGGIGEGGAGLPIEAIDGGINRIHSRNRGVEE
jgi:hypothetical protein